MSKLLIKIGVTLLGILVLVVVVMGYEIYSYLKSPITRLQTPTSQVITIPKGTGFNQIVKILNQKELLDDPARFQSLARYRKALTKLKAGEFVIQRHWTPDELLEHLISGRSVLYKVTIPEGLHYNEIANRLVAKGLGSLPQFLKLKKNSKLLQLVSISPTPESLEGVLFPETYFFTKAESEYDILARMIQQFNQNFDESIKQRARELGLTDLEVLTLASIVEKETGIHEDRPLVSAVFHNRLKRRMRLESDPTVIYGIKDFDGNLTRKHLKTPNAYNTYTQFGLPPGPICNPGKASIESTLHPANVPYLYFVARGDGSSQFSTNLKAHNRAVWKYQKRRRKR